MTLNYYGGAFVARQGHYTGSIDALLWARVQKRFEEFLTHGPATPFGCTDHPEFEFWVESDSGFNRFLGNSGMLTAKDQATMHWFMSLVDSAAQLQRCDTVVFRTHIQVAEPWHSRSVTFEEP